MGRLGQGDLLPLICLAYRACVQRGCMLRCHCCHGGAERRISLAHDPSSLLHVTKTEPHIIGFPDVNHYRLLSEQFFSV